MVHNDLFIFDNVISITLKVPSIRILLSMGSLNGKNRLSEGHPRFLTKFPFVNLQIISLVESLSPTAKTGSLPTRPTLYNPICLQRPTL